MITALLKKLAMTSLCLSGFDVGVSDETDVVLISRLSNFQAIKKEA